MPFLVCGKTGQKPVSDFLSCITYNSAGLPENMEYSEKEDVWCAQFEYKPEAGEIAGWPEGDSLKINLFLDMKDQMLGKTATGSHSAIHVLLMKHYSS